MKLKDEIERFDEKIHNLVPKYPANAIFNFDQSAFNYENHSNRTLAHQGSHLVQVQTNAPNDMTHSLTIMPIISSDGILHRKLFIQIGSEFPKMKEVFTASNIVTIGGSSSMMGKRTLKVILKDKDLSKTITRSSMKNVCCLKLRKTHC